MAYVKSNSNQFIEWSVKICKVFGLDANKVRSIDLHIGANEIVSISIKRFVTVDEMPELIELLGELELKEKVTGEADHG